MKKFLIVLCCIVLVSCSSKTDSNIDINTSNQSDEIVITQTPEISIEQSVEKPVEKSTEIPSNEKSDSEKEISKPSSTQETPKSNKVENPTPIKPITPNAVEKIPETPDIQTSATSNPTEPIKTDKNIVFLSIIGDDGYKILENTEINFKDGDTVFDVLAETTKNNKIQFDYSGTASTIYVKGIDNLYEFDRGKNSGWKYTVNNIYPDYSAGDYTLVKGDVINWIYVK